MCSESSLQVWEGVLRHVCGQPRSLHEFASFRAVALTCRSLYRFMIESPTATGIFRMGFHRRWSEGSLRLAPESDAERASFWFHQLVQRDASYIHPLLNEDERMRIKAALGHWDLGDGYNPPLGEVFALPIELCAVGREQGLLKMIELIRADFPVEDSDLQNMLLDVLGLEQVTAERALEMLRYYPTTSRCYGKPQPPSQHEQSSIDSLSAMLMVPAAPLMDLRPKMDEYEWYLISDVPEYESVLRYWVNATYSGCCEGLFCVSYDKGLLAFITAAGNS